MNKLAAFYLVIVAALWGLTFPLIETSVASLDPLIFVALRFTVAALPVVFYYMKHLDRACLKVGAALGVMHLGAFVFQTIGLQTVNASRAAFLTGIYVLMIPFLSPFLKMGRPTLHDVISALICCFGIYVLTGMDIGDFSLGDSWIILGDLFIAISVIYIGKHAQNNMDPYMLAYGQIVMTGLFSWVPVLLFSSWDFSPILKSSVWSSLLICSLFSTILAIILQSKYQKFVSIQYTALIFSTEPLFASLFDTLLTSSPPTAYTLVGGMIILISILYLELWSKKSAAKESDAVAAATASSVPS